MALSDLAQDWTVNIPLSDLVALQQLPNRVKMQDAEIAQLRRELDALRAIQSQTLQLIADMKRERKSG